MRILHVIGCFPPAGEWGGASAAALGTCRALKQNGVEVEVYTTTQRSKRDLPAIEAGKREVEGVATTYFRSVHRLGRAFFAPRLLAALWGRVREFDLVHIHMLWTFPGIAAANVCRARGVPYAISIHGALDPWALRQRRLEKRLFLMVTERRNLERASFIHFTFESERALAPIWASRLSAAVIPYAFDANPYLGLGDVRERRRCRDVLILARIHPMKGFDILIPAMAQVVSREPAARLIVAGPDEGGYLVQVRRLVAEAGIARQVVFTGYLDPAARARALAAAAILVAPSHRENFCLSVAEGMAAGLPVVVSDKVNICDDVSAAGAGRVIPLNSTRLAEVLLELLAAPEQRERMGAAGRQLVIERYAPKTIGEHLADAYHTVISGRALQTKGL